MSSIAERAEMVFGAYELAETYLTPEERITLQRVLEIYEAAQEDLDPNYMGLSQPVLARTYEEVPDGQRVEEKRRRIAHDLLLSGKFGQVDWNL